MSATVGHELIPRVARRFRFNEPIRHPRPPLLRDSLQQWIVGLIFVDRTGLGLKAGDQAETFDRVGDRRGTAHGWQENRSSLSSGGLCSRARVTWGENLRGSGASPTRTSARSTLSCSATSSGERSTPTHRLRGLSPPPKTPVPAICRVNRRARSRANASSISAATVFAGLTDEPQGQVEVAGIYPFRPGLSPSIAATAEA